VAGSLDKFATEIRNLQRPEIDELAEPFVEGKQVGSSAMPQKRNPWRSENISGLARMERSLVGPALESIITWHERDLAQSATERFVIPESFIIIDHMLNSMIRVLGGLRVNEKGMLENLMKFKGPLMSESVLTSLVNKGMSRQEAHSLLQKLVFESRDKHVNFGETLKHDPVVAKYLTATELDLALDPKAYLGMSKELVDSSVEKAISERRARGLTA
jgi:adenylosuccinate lyase